MHSFARGDSAGHARFATDPRALCKRIEQLLGLSHELFRELLRIAHAQDVGLAMMHAHRRTVVRCAGPRALVAHVSKHGKIRILPFPVRQFPSAFMMHHHAGSIVGKVMRYRAGDLAGMASRAEFVVN